MKAAPLLIEWHNDKSPIWSVHFEPHGRGRLATAGGDNNVRIWQQEENGDERKFTYLSTLAKHTQAVNVVRWCPKSGQEVLASAGDDGNVLLWIPSDVPPHIAYGSEAPEDKETWQVKRVHRSTSGAEIYDLAWSPDGNFFVTGSMDNVARIFDAHTGSIVRQIAEHNNYVQGVAWDPLNEFLATQSSDRSVHIYKLRTNDGQFSLAQHSRIAKMDLPARRISSNPPVVPDFGARAQFAEGIAQSLGSPLPSAPGTPNSLPLPMNPPPSHSRRSSFGAASSPSIRRSASPAPSLPLPAVMPPASPNPYFSLTARNAELYANETLTSFFRRLTFTPDGSLLLTPAGQYKTLHPNNNDSSKPTADVINTVYIYSRAGLNKPPIAHLPGHKKPSIAIKCSPVLHELRQSMSTKHITVDTSSQEGNDSEMTPLPEPVMPSKIPSSHSTMEPPPISAPSPAQSQQACTPNPQETESSSSTPGSGPQPAFALPYRIVYAVATQDAVFVYDTQQQTPICVVSNLHFSTFTDLTWSSDGLTLVMASSDGFCSALNFAPGELGTPYQGPLSTKQHRLSIVSASSHGTPTATSTHPPPLIKHASSSYKPPQSPGPGGQPASPTRTNSASSIATMASFAPSLHSNDPIPTFGHVPSVAASATYAGTAPPIMSPTPPMTPLPSGTSSFAASSQMVLGKREGEDVARDETKEPKKRRIAPTLLSTPAQGR